MPRHHHTAQPRKDPQIASALQADLSSRKLCGTAQRNHLSHPLCTPVPKKPSRLFRNHSRNPGYTHVLQCRVNRFHHHEGFSPNSLFFEMFCRYFLCQPSIASKHKRCHEIIMISTLLNVFSITDSRPLIGQACSKRGYAHLFELLLYQPFFHSSKAFPAASNNS